mgnify:CR=1 FL=1
MIAGRAADGSSSHDRAGTPNHPSTVLSVPAGAYSPLNTSEITTTDTTLGMKKPTRNSVRPRNAGWTASARSSASAVVSGIVPMTKNAVLPSALQNVGSVSACA